MDFLTVMNTFNTDNSRQFSGTYVITVPYRKINRRVLAEKCVFTAILFSPLRRAVTAIL